MQGAPRVEISARLCYNCCMTVRVYAKLNLTLSVGDKQGKFHSVDSLVSSVDIFDEVTVVPRTDGKIYVRCDDASIPAEANSALRAATLFQNAFCTDGVEIFVRKGIPIGAGMGGSSADAAAVTYCMCKLFGADVNSAQVRRICAESGSDVNFMLRGGFARMRGKGDDLTFARLSKPLYFALTTFDAQLSTAKVYAEFDALRLGANKQKTALTTCSAQTFAETVASDCARAVFFNDLQQAARALTDCAENYISYTNACGWACCMTGSGSAYFVPFGQEKAAEQAVRRLNANGFSSRLCRTVSEGIREV